MFSFDLTPDPKVLIALTHTPMQPLDALCELIDNSIDSFQAAMLKGEPVQSPLVILELPKKQEVNQGTGCVRVRDNGPGLSPEMAEKALRVGFSGNNQYDSLGLFGMGFNISTGKLGRRTRFFTSRRADGAAIEVVIDLEEINAAKSYQVPVTGTAKPKGFEQGTLIEVSGWWPEGNPNKGFILKLIQYGLPLIRREIGRRYSTILREKKIQIVINDEHVKPFEHCAWSDSRFVERRGAGQIPAVIRFDHVAGTQIRCTSCTALLEDGQTCPVCGSSGSRTVEERIRGWVGIQRFDDPVEYGIDLIRNGRAIRISEKAAFFEYIDDFKRIVKDYPIDSPYGRIIGEVHLNHCPVDFLKQDFQRSSPEWQRALSFLRGDSSLQPSQPGADTNSSPVYKLYQGYRRVRSIGRGDMYMGYWDAAGGVPKRISRETEKEYYEKFLLRQPGYYDDAEWWKLVEEADRKPLEELVECPECGGQNLAGFDVCQLCGAIIEGRECLNPDCRVLIPKGAASCPHCGNSQYPEVKKEWTCALCGYSNASETVACLSCGASRDSLHPLSKEALMQNARKDDELSIDVCTVALSDGSQSTPLKVHTFVTARPIIPPENSRPIPLVSFKEPDAIEIFIDTSHPLFTNFDVHPEQMIASEAAIYIFDCNRRLVQHQGSHSVAAIQSDIIRERWAGKLENEAVNIQSEISSFFKLLRESIAVLLKDAAEDIFKDLPPQSQRNLVENILGHSKDLAELQSMRDTGEFMLYIDNDTLLSVFRNYFDRFFDGAVWKEPLPKASGFSEDVISGIYQKMKLIYMNCLEDLATFSTLKEPEREVSLRARCSLLFLKKRLA